MRLFRKRCTMEKKYVLTEESRIINSWYGREITLRKIVAIKDFDVSCLQSLRIFVGDQSHIERKIVIKHIKAGDSGGWIESESNLSQEGNAWVDKGAVVFDKSVVKDDSWVGGEKTAIAGRVIVCDESIVFSDDRDRIRTNRTEVVGNIIIRGYSKITSSLSGEGIVKNKLINKPTKIIPMRNPSEIKVKFECSVGNKRIAREFTF